MLLNLDHLAVALASRREYQYKAALPLYRHAHAGQKVTLGTCHPVVLPTQRNIKICPSRRLLLLFSKLTREERSTQCNTFGLRISYINLLSRFIRPYLLLLMSSVAICSHKEPISIRAADSINLSMISKSIQATPPTELIVRPRLLSLFASSSQRNLSSQSVFNSAYRY